MTDDSLDSTETATTVLEFSGFRCEICSIHFPTKRALAEHNVGRHKPIICHLCNETFEKRGKFGLHKIQKHGYTREQLGWRLIGGWNKGLTQLEAFTVTGNTHHGNAEFMNKLNSPGYLKMKRRSRNYHEDVVLQKEKELIARGYRTFCASNYAHHKRVPDFIAISPDGKIVAVEMESFKPYKSSEEAIRKRYTNLL